MEEKVGGKKKKRKKKTPPCGGSLSPLLRVTTMHPQGMGENKLKKKTFIQRADHIVFHCYKSHGKVYEFLASGLFSPDSMETQKVTILISRDKYIASSLMSLF